ncbi:MAG: hypothetical protein WBQ86_02195 [Candidatus Binatus sp.]
MTEPTEKPTPPSQVERAADFRTYYANNVYIESTAWDLKITFGQLDRATAPLLVKNECSVTLPWPQAKLALFWIALHVEMAEAEVGQKIPVRKDLWPQELPEKLPDNVETDAAAAERFRRIYNRLREEFLKTA